MTFTFVTVVTRFEESLLCLKKQFSKLKKKQFTQLFGCIFNIGLKLGYKLPNEEL